MGHSGFMDCLWSYATAPNLPATDCPTCNEKPLEGFGTLRQAAPTFTS